MKKGKIIDIQELVQEVEHYPIIFVGDHHDTNQTHKFFNEFLQALADSHYNLYMANEWFTPEHDELLKSYTNNDINATVFKRQKRVG